MGEAPPAEGSGQPGAKAEWSLNQPPEYIIELWSVDATIEAILEALAYRNERFIEEIKMLLNAKKRLEK